MDCKPFRMGHGQKVRNRQMSVLRGAVRKAASLEKVLQPQVSVECLGREASPEGYGMNLVERRDGLQLPHFRFGHRGICVYCGDPADTIDHVIPLAWSLGRKKSKRTPVGPVCPACRDCNSHLASRYFDCFWDRCRWNRDRIEKRALPILWFNHQIQELDYTMRSFVAHQCFVRLWYRIRADWFESPDFLMGVEDLLWQDFSHHSDMEIYFGSTIREVKELLSHP